MELKRLLGLETGVQAEFAANWESEGIAFYEDVVYGQGGGHNLYMDLMIPEHQSKDSSPVMVWVHGGGWSSAELTKKYRPTQAILQLCKAGFVCASIDYRLVTEAPFPAPIEDCKCAIRFLKAHAAVLNIDPSEIGIWGESAGGQLAALVGASYMNQELEGNGGWENYSSEVKAVCDWYCGGDMTHMGAYQAAEVQNRARSLGIQITQMSNSDFPKGNEKNGFDCLIFGKPGYESYKLAMDISPIFYIEHKQPAYLLMHGDIDQTVPIEFSYNFYDALLSHGHDATFVIIPRQGHGFFKGEGYYDIVINFLKKHLQ